MEDQGIIISEADSNHPVLLIPRTCTTLETNCQVADNVFIYLNITSQDIEGNEINVYTGICNVKILDNSSVKVLANETGQSLDSVSSPNAVIAFDAGCQDTVIDGQIWADEAQNQHSYNSHDAMDSETLYSMYHHNDSGHITVQQHNTYITQNVYNYNELVQYSTNNCDDTTFGRVGVSENQSSTDPSIDEEIEYDVFLNQLPEEILTDNQKSARDELKYVGMQSDNEALNQLMSADIQSLPKQQRTILYVGNNSSYGQTIQNIAVNNPEVRCKERGDDKQSNTDTSVPNNKKYQCDKCKRIFDQINSFRLHIEAIHKEARSPRVSKSSKCLGHTCCICGKVLKTEKKFQSHVSGHGNPELECDTCRKVFSSKFTLRNHKKLHLRIHKCVYCSKSYYTLKELKDHRSKMHFVMNCNVCDFYTTEFSELKSHYKSHKRDDVIRNDSETTLSLEEGLTRTKIGSEPRDLAIQPSYEDLNVKDMEPDTVIAKVMSNQVFMLHAKKARKHGNKKTCNVCNKSFDRVSDLKRHLIEHVIRSTLAKAPLKNGSLCVKCEVCQRATFTRLDKYKAHLREHAKLTLYKCIFCDKSFSDSSNFSKHKKIHGTTYLQCDLCLRKFKSKKTLTHHMEYHNKNTAVSCIYCDKQFHFPSMLHKHVKMVHKRVVSRTRCRFCQVYFGTLKEKWDHDWLVHHVRKLIVDCLVCDSKFRKYTELKVHCKHVHGIRIPPATKLLKKLQVF